MCYVGCRGSGVKVIDIDDHHNNKGGCNICTVPQICLCYYFGNFYCYIIINVYIYIYASAVQICVASFPGETAGSYKAYAYTQIAVDMDDIENFYIVCFLFDVRCSGRGGVLE